jgi:spermidine synthase
MVTLESPAVKAFPFSLDRGRRRALGSDGLRTALPFIIFFFSGFAALSYQVVWQRMLTFFTGAEVASVTLIVAAFMAGLGFGSLAGGGLADRLRPRQALAAFAAAEGLIGLFGAFSQWLYYDLLDRGLGTHLASPVARGLLLFASLLFPTFLMGASLPLLARALTLDIGRAPRTLGLLYGVNTLGSSIGALVSHVVLARAVGFVGTLYVAAAINGLVMLLALVPPPRGAEESPSSRHSTPGDPGSATHSWILLYALSGFLALSLEILWFRMLGVMLKAVSITFPYLLSLYLLGLALGSIAGTLGLRRIRDPRATFLWLQSGIAFYAGASVTTFILVVNQVSWLSPVWQYLARPNNISWPKALSAIVGLVTPGGAAGTADVELALTFLLTHVLVPVLLFFPPTFMMGLSFPCIQQITQSDPLRLGRRVGALQTSNILGATLGTLAVGYWGLDHLSTASMLRILTALGSAFLLFHLATLSRESPATRRAGLAGAGIALVALAVPPDLTFWARLHGAEAKDIVLGEAASGVAVLERRAGDTLVRLDGVEHSALPFDRVHVELGAIPALLHPRPESVAIIGLGSGATAFGAAGRPETTRLVCVEIVEPLRGVLEYEQSRSPHGGLGTLLSLPRLEYVVGDGRAFLLRNAARYDIIEADALHPRRAFAGNLYSREYFELLRSRLNPGGFAVSYEASGRTLRTFQSVFPHVVRMGVVLVGSEREIAIDRERVLRQAAEPATRQHYSRGGFDIEQIAAAALSAAETLDPLSDALDLNHDLFPRDEYGVPEAVAAHRDRAAIY